MKRFRLSTLMLLVVIVALGVAFAAEREQAIRRDALFKSTEKQLLWIRGSMSKERQKGDWRWEKEEASMRERSDWREKGCE